MPLASQERYAGGHRDDTMSFAEWIGYAGSVIVLISLLMKSLLKLRWINLVGSLLFAIYGLSIKAWPVFGINAVIAVIDGWFLFRMLKDTDYFDLAPLKEIGTEYFKKFFLYHETDIKAFFPASTFEELVGLETYILFRNMLPVGFFSMRVEGENAKVVADYVVAEYRDFKTGVFLYRIKRMYFKQMGVKRFIADSGGKAHQHYLRRNGFRPADERGPNLFVKEL